jgi:hypothetical protein
MVLLGRHLAAALVVTLAGAATVRADQFVDAANNTVELNHYYAGQRLDELLALGDEVLWYTFRGDSISATEAWFGYISGILSYQAACGAMGGAEQALEQYIPNLLITDTMNGDQAAYNADLQEALYDAQYRRPLFNDVLDGYSAILNQMDLMATQASMAGLDLNSPDFLSLANMISSESIDVYMSALVTGGVAANLDLFIQFLDNLANPPP